MVGKKKFSYSKKGKAAAKKYAKKTGKKMKSKYQIIMLTTKIAKLRGEIIVPLTAKGKKMMSAMKKQYGAKKAKPIFYATVKKKKLKGMEKKKKK